MKKNVVSMAHAKGLAVLLAFGMMASSMPADSVDGKVKKPKLSTTKVTVSVGKTKKVTVKNAKKVTWKLSKKSGKIVKLTKKSKKGATIKGLRKGTADISVAMKAGKKTYKKTIKVTVKSKDPVKKDDSVTVKNNATPTPTAKTSNSPTPPAKTDNTPTPTPTATPTATPTVTPTATPTPVPPEEPSSLVLEGDDLGESASFTYKPNGFAAYSSMGIFAIDKSKLTEGSTIVLTYTAVEGESDVKDTQGFNIALKTGDKWNSPGILDAYGKMGGSISIPITADHLAKIGEEDTVYMHVSTASAGFKGTFTYTSVEVGGESLVESLPPTVSYVENGMNQYAPTAKVNLPADIDFSKYKTCKIEFTSSDPEFEFHGILGHKVDGAEVTDPKYGVTSTGLFEITLNNVLAATGTDPFVVINAGQKGFAGSVTITKITFEP